MVPLFAALMSTFSRLLVLFCVLALGSAVGRAQAGHVASYDPSDPFALALSRNLPSPQFDLPVAVVLTEACQDVLGDEPEGVDVEAGALAVVYGIADGCAYVQADGRFGFVREHVVPMEPGGVVRGATAMYPPERRPQFVPMPLVERGEAPEDPD